MTNVRVLPQKQIASSEKYPSMREVRAAIPSDCFERRLSISFVYAFVSLFLTFGSVLLAYFFLPLEVAWAPVWLLYAVICGTCATGVWVVAHECGHRAFCESTRIQDTVGFVLHSMLLVPYFSWQRSHAVHHAKTNHLHEGETHVPKVRDSARGRRSSAIREKLGEKPYAVLTLLGRLLFGWPVYLLTGATGAPSRGMTNHFWPGKPFSSALFPNRWPRKVLISSAGVFVTCSLLVLWSLLAGSIIPVLVFYVAPYLVCNAWLVVYTWLQHTDVDIPHYAGDDWSFVRGAFCSVDRPYGSLFNFLHHNIGSTHVVHHLDAKIPHYHAVKATKAIAAQYPHLYRYDETPVLRALWRVAKDCCTVAPSGDGWVYTDKDMELLSQR